MDKVRNGLKKHDISLVLPLFFQGVTTFGLHQSTMVVDINVNNILFPSL